MSVVSTVEHRPFHSDEINGDSSSQDSSETLLNASCELPSSSPDVRAATDSNTNSEPTEVLTVVVEKPNVDENGNPDHEDRMIESPIEEFVSVQEFREEVVESADCVDVPMDIDEEKMETYVIVDEIKCSSDSSGEDSDSSPVNSKIPSKSNQIFPG